MVRIWVALLVGFVLVIPAQAQPVRFSAALDAELLAAGPERQVDVIVRFKGRLDPRQFKDENRRVRRQKLITALRRQAVRSEQPLRTFLLEHPGHRLTSLWLINGASLRLPAPVVKKLMRVANVESVGLDGTLAVPPTSPAISAPAEWNLALIGAPDLWQQGHRGDGVVVALLDTGVDPEHPDIGPKWRGGSNSWFDPYGQHLTPSDNYGHGTQALGLIVGGDAGGSAIGVAPAARWIAAKIFNDTGNATYSAIHQAFQWAMDPDGDPAVDDAPDIVNSSWGLSQLAGTCDLEFQTDIDTLRAADIAVVVSAGNAGPATATSVSPANYAQVLSVGAVSSELAVANFSSRGPSACDGTMFPAVVAPGVNVRTADLTFSGLIPDAYIDVAGTSYAVAHVAGGAALLKSAVPEATASQIESALRTTAIDIDAIGADNDSGLGVVDLVAAQQSLSQTTTSHPGTLQFAFENYRVSENGGPISLVVNRVGGSSGPVSVMYSTADGTANAGSDYLAAAGTLSFAAGETSQSLAVTILNDALAEGEETFTVTLAYADGGSSLGWPESTVVTIFEQNSTGVTAVSDTYTMVEDGSLTIAAPGVLANDSGVGLSAMLVDTVTQGSLALGADGAFNFTPPANFSGVIQFSYQASDGSGLSDPVPVSITVTPVNDVPVAHPDAYATSIDTALKVRAPGVLANDSDPDSTALRVRARAVTPPAHGTLSINGAGRFIYTPDPGFTGVDSFTYKIRDDLGATSNAAVVTITVHPAQYNFEPVAKNDYLLLLQDTQGRIRVLKNDRDPDGTLVPATVTIVTPPAMAGNSARANSNGVIIFTPGPGFLGSDTLEYQVSDNEGAVSNIAAVRVDVVQ